MKKFLKLIILIFIFNMSIVNAESLTLNNVELIENNSNLTYNPDNNLISFNDYNQLVKFKITLKNNTENTIKIDNFTINKINNLDISYSNLTANEVIRPNILKDIYLTIKSNKINTNINSNLTFDIRYSELETEDLKDSIDTPISSKEDELPPKTKEILSKYLKIITVLTSIYLLLLIYFKLKNINYFKTISIIYLIILLITIIIYFIEASYSINPPDLNIDIKIEYKPKRVLMKRDYSLDNDENTIWEYCNKIKTIYFQNKLELEEYERIYDVSMNQDESILAYLVKRINDSSYYDLYITSEDKILTNVDSGYLFSGFTKLTNINNINTLDTLYTKDMTNLFSKDKLLEEIDLDSFDTRNVTDMSYMFQECSKIIINNLNKLNTSNVTTMSNMFRNYSTNIKLDLSNFNTSKVTDMSYMFSNYASDKPLDLSNFDITNVTNMSYMFNYYKSSADLDISSFEFTSIPQYLFSNNDLHNIYVKNEAIKQLLVDKNYKNITADNVLIKE